MAITYNGVAITNWTYNGITGTVTFEGVQIWPVSANQVWVYLFIATSEISHVYELLGTIVDPAEQLWEMNEYGTPNSYSIGDIGYYITPDSTLYAYVIEAE